MRKYLILAITLFTISVYSQKQITARLAKADEPFKKGFYFKALEEYQKLYTQATETSVKLFLANKQSECFAQLYNYAKAAEFNKIAIDLGCTDKNVYIHYANALKCQGKYDAAIEVFKKIIELKSDSSLMPLIADCKEAKANKDIPAKFSVKNASPMNSTSNDYAPSYNDKKYKSLIFTSCGGEKVTTKKIDPRTGQKYPDLLSVKYNPVKDEYTELAALPEPITTDFGEATAKSNEKFSFMYYVSFSEEKGYMLRVTAKQGASFSLPDGLPIPGLNDTTYINAPCVSKDHLIMVISANLPGGYGGKDLWAIIRRREKGQWLEKPVNLGPVINTAGDEDYPYFQNNNFYFSSNGHGGFGGLDIFKAKMDTNNGISFKGLSHLSYPLNSEAEDFGIIVEEAGDRGFLTSNRAGGKGGFDIYSFESVIPRYSLKITVIDKQTRAIVPGAYLKLKATAPNDLLGKTNNDGNFTYNEKVMVANANYTLTVGKLDVMGKPAYKEAVVNVTTIGAEENPSMLLTVEIDPIP